MASTTTNAGRVGQRAEAGVGGSPERIAALMVQMTAAGHHLERLALAERVLALRGPAVALEAAELWVAGCREAGL